MKASQPIPENPHPHAGDEDIKPSLRDRRLSLFKTLTEVANETGLSKAYLSLVERNLLTPTPETLKKIEKALETKK